MPGDDAKIRLTYGEGAQPRTQPELTNGSYLGVLSYEFLPGIKCTGTHGETCHLLDWPPAIEPLTGIAMQDFQVKYQVERTNLRPGASDASRLAGPDAITLESYRPPGMESTRISVTVIAPWLRVEVDSGSDVVHDDFVSPMFLRGPDELPVPVPVVIADERSHQGEHVQFVQKFDHRRTVSVFMSETKKVADETATVVLQHVPRAMTPLDYKELPVLPIPEMRKPLRPPRMTTPNSAP